ncbi:VOC family protein [Gluconacetobacter tumulicola]|uniref:VOC family protein n=1 Tax=Gluconacetobacter tumulicola TaxID=1017177 RepID=UPI0033852CEC
MNTIATGTGTIPPFHLAFPVRDIAEARAFYGELLGCPEGRSAPDWVDFDFYGHQIVAHLAPAELTPAQRNEVDDHAVAELARRLEGKLIPPPFPGP